MEPPSNSPIANLTKVGRVLLNIHLVLGFGGTALYIIHFVPELPPGGYPIFTFAVPVGLGCLVSFLAIAWILERCGIRVYAKKD
jgi:hypothetical protein